MHCSSDGDEGDNRHDDEGKATSVARDPQLTFVNTIIII